MPEAVIDRLEVIEVHERDRPKVAFRVCERGLEARVEQAAVRQPRERVVAGSVPQTVLAAAQPVRHLTQQRPGGQQRQRRHQPLSGGRAADQRQRTAIRQAQPHPIDRKRWPPEEADRVQPHPQVVEGIDAARIAARDERQADQEGVDGERRVHHPRRLRPPTRDQGRSDGTERQRGAGNRKLLCASRVRKDEPEHRQGAAQDVQRGQRARGDHGIIGRVAFTAGPPRPYRKQADRSGEERR